MLLASSTQFLYFLETLLFMTVLLMHLAKKNSTVIILYVLQSAIVVTALFLSALSDSSIILITVTTITLLIKVIVAPYFLLGLIRKHKLQFSMSTYINSPLTLIAIAGLAAFSYSKFFHHLDILAPTNENALFLALSMMFVSIFLIVNRKGALSQMLGVLSLENAIVSFSNLAGLEASAGAQIGILFDICIWIIIATVFASMIYQHFGSLSTAEMQRLKEE